MLYDTKNPHGGDIYAGNVRLDFSANTNPFGTPESVLAAITRALPEVHRYPDPYCRALCAAIAAAEGVPEEYILCGSGAAELIYAFADAVAPPSSRRRLRNIRSRSRARAAPWRAIRSRRRTILRRTAAF